jgi:hypothetical protein
VEDLTRKGRRGELSLHRAGGGRGRRGARRSRRRPAMSSSTEGRPVSGGEVGGWGGLEKEDSEGDRGDDLGASKVTVV